MGLERETKLKVESLDPVRRRIEELCGRLLGRGLETNWILDRPDGALQERGEGLRIRRFAREDGTSPSTITFKGPTRAIEIKTREELETTLGDAATGLELLNRLGFPVVLCYEKRRESWQVNGCRVELDDVPVLGRFVEIEGPDDHSILAVKDQLGLKRFAPTMMSYVGMLMAHCESLGWKEFVITFDRVGDPGA